MTSSCLVDLPIAISHRYAGREADAACWEYAQDDGFEGADRLESRGGIVRIGGLVDHGACDAGWAWGGRATCSR